MNISVIIPCHNEENVIEEKLINTLSLGETVKEIVVIADHCTDDTYNKASLFSKRDKRIKVIQNKDQAGKKFAVKSGINNSSEEIILMTDADAFLSPDTISKVWPYLNNPKIGAVSLSNNLIFNKNDKRARSYTDIYENLVRQIRILESKIDSVVAPYGQALFFRRKLNVLPTRQADDVDIGIQTRKKGYLVKFIPDCYFTENLLGDEKNLKQQKIRRCKALIDSVLHHKDVFFNPRYGFYGFLCYPLDLTFFILSPYILLATMVIILICEYVFLSPLTATLSLILIMLLLIFTRLRSILILSVVSFKAMLEYLREGSDSEWNTPRLNQRN